ncbi:MAG TPA: hypothetical protein VGR50_08795 [Terriglobales bacterium]|nr:hypothetical protein [Terriglobales bacterium]
MQRPTGVTVIAILQFLAAGVLLLGGIAFMVGMGAMGAVMAQRGAGGGPGGMGMGVLAGLGALLGVVLVALAVLYGITGFGMWNLKNWARIVTLIFTGLGAIFHGFSMLASLIHFHIFALIWGGMWLAVHVLIIWYLLQPDVVRAFESGGTANAAAR